MRPPENDEGRPRARAAPNVETGEGIDTTSVRHASDSRTRMRRYPVAYAHQHSPDGKRTQWWITYACPHCEHVHLGRSREQLSDGVRPTRCGRLVWLTISPTNTRSAA